MTLSTMCEDAQAVLNYATLLGFSDFAFLGTRVGALVAAATVASTSSTPLVLWEPVTDVIRFIKEAQRARRISETAQGRVEPIDWREELERNGMLDLLGYDAYRPLIDSLEGADLVAALGVQQRPIFIARFGGRLGSNDYLMQALNGRGLSVQERSFDLTESWWFHNELPPETGDLIAQTTNWLSQVFTVDG